MGVVRGSIPRESIFLPSDLRAHQLTAYFVVWNKIYFYITFLVSQLGNPRAATLEGFNLNVNFYQLNINQAIAPLFALVA